MELAEIKDGPGPENGVEGNGQQKAWPCVVSTPGAIVREIGGEIRSSGDEIGLRPHGD